MRWVTSGYSGCLSVDKMSGLTKCVRLKGQKIMKQASVVTVLIVGNALTGSVLSANEGTDGVLTALEADDLVVVQAGEKVYHQHCAVCHGDQLQGQPDWRTRGANGLLPAPPHDASGHTWHHADDLLFEITKYGPAVVIGDSSYQTAMPAYEQILSDAEIVAVLSFIKSTWPDDERGWQEQVNGTQLDGMKSVTKRKSSLMEKLNK